MKTSNSKLSKIEKDLLKQYKIDYPEIKFYRNGRVTFAYTLNNSGKGKISWSLASEQEKKLRPKVGEYNAMMRYLNEQNLPVEFLEFQSQPDSEITYVLDRFTEAIYN